MLFVLFIIIFHAKKSDCLLSFYINDIFNIHIFYLRDKFEPKRDTIYESNPTYGQLRLPGAEHR